MSNRIAALSYTGRRMIAASLEIDGRVDTAAEAAVGGHISELTYVPNEAKTAYVPQSPKAIQLEELKAELEAEIARVGVDALIEELRTLRRPVTPITEVVKDQGGRDDYSVQIPCPSCDMTGRSGIQGCGRCAGAGHMWTKPAVTTAAERRAIMAAEAEAREPLAVTNDAILAAEAKQAEELGELFAEVAAENGAAAARRAVEALPEFTRRMLSVSLEIDGDAALAVSYALNGTDRLGTFKSGPNERMHAATPEQEQAAAAALAGLEAMIEADGLEATIATLRPRKDEHAAAIEAQVAEFAAILNAAPSKPLVYTVAAFDGRPGFRSVPCDSCFGRGRRDWPFVGPVRVKCFRCEGAGAVMMNQAMIDAKLTPVADEPTQDPADLDDDEPTADRARVWDEAAAAYMAVPVKHRHMFPLVNPYAAPDAEPCGHEIAGRTLEDAPEYCETPADECDRHDS